MVHLRPTQGVCTGCCTVQRQTQWPAPYSTMAGCVLELQRSIPRHLCEACAGKQLRCSAGAGWLQKQPWQAAGPRPCVRALSLKAEP